MTYGAVVGMNYRFKAWKPFGKIRTLEGDKFMDNTFISIAAGGQFQASRLTNEIGLTKSIGPHFSLSVGKWLIPALGLRLSGFRSDDTWHKRRLSQQMTTREKSFMKCPPIQAGVWKVCWTQLTFQWASTASSFLCQHTCRRRTGLHKERKRISSSQRRVYRFYRWSSTQISVRR